MAPLYFIRHHQLGCFAFARNDGWGMRHCVSDPQ